MRSIIHVTSSNPERHLTGEGVLYVTHLELLAAACAGKDPPLAGCFDGGGRAEASRFRQPHIFTRPPPRLDVAVT